MSNLPLDYIQDPDINRNFETLARKLTELSQRFFWGNGSPENVVTSPVGGIYLRLDGGAITTLYVKEAGVAKVGWVAK